MPNGVKDLIRKLVKPFARTVLHPQWLSYRDNVLRYWLKQVKRDSIVLDIGCNDRWPQHHLDDSCAYYGLDYYSASSKLYQSSVDIFGDAQQLPIGSKQLDTVILFDVLEHIPSASNALSEINRTLKVGGQLLVQTPFIYPIHDAPSDFRRPTIHGIERLAKDSGFIMSEFKYRGAPIETACLLLNIALSSRVLGLLRSKFFVLGVLAIPLLSVFVVLSNMVGWLDSCIGTEKADSLMPFSYQFKLIKQADD